MKLVFVLSVIWITSSVLIYADTLSPSQSDRGTLSIYVDNDLYVGKDRDYTNGARLSWISDARDTTDIGDVDGLLSWVRLGITGNVHYHYGFSLTQLIYKPEDFLSFDQPHGERRYAGWLALGFSLHAQNEHALNSMEFTLGTTGPNAFAKETQNAIHELRDVEKFNGWDNQIPNEITVDLSFIQKHRVEFDFMEQGSFDMDGIGEWGARLGTFRTSAHLGTTLRAGFHLTSDFSDLRLSENAFSHSNINLADAKSSRWSAYLLGGALARGIAHDATLDGPLFRDFETGNTREPWVAEAFLGLSLVYRGVEFSYVHTWRSKEYKEQDGISEFGSVGFRSHF